jgi:hypothetical protein
LRPTFQFCSQQRCDILPRKHSKHPRILAAELRRALTDLKGGLDIGRARNHQPARFEQAELLLEFPPIIKASTLN